MKNETKSVVNVGRIVLASMMFLFGVFCFYVLKEGFTIWFLMLGIAAVGGGIFNLKRGLAIKKGAKKDSGNKQDFTL